MFVFYSGYCCTCDLHFVGFRHLQTLYFLFAISFSLDITFPSYCSPLSVSLSSFLPLSLPFLCLFLSLSLSLFISLFLSPFLYVFLSQLFSYKVYIYYLWCPLFSSFDVLALSSSSFYSSSNVFSNLQALTFPSSLNKKETIRRKIKI